MPRKKKVVGPSTVKYPATSYAEAIKRSKQKPEPAPVEEPAKTEEDGE